MTKKKGKLQKVSFASGLICFFLAIVSGVALYLRDSPVDSSDAISASLAATAFFFVSAGFVLVVMGKADIPSFKVDNTDEK